ncbi:MAG: aminoglycoside phosphotransferase family protein [Acidiferrobacterales bacterium]
MKNRNQQMTEWLDGIGLRARSIAPASADASFRQYFRVVSDAGSYIVMDAPPDKEDTGPFVRIAQQFRKIGLNVPEVIEQDRDNGFLLLSDLGQQTYLELLDLSNVGRLYGDAMDALMLLQIGTNTDPDFLPAYDRRLLLDEMALFQEWLLRQHLGLDLNDEQLRVLQDSFDFLASSALEQPSVWVHRDYHSRNLMRTEEHNPGILDFQDAVSGPVTYDLVSLLKDCYIDWPREQVESWVKGYHQLSLESGLQITEDAQEYLRWFDLMGAQRHLKASGIFARLYHRDSKSGYLADIPRTVGYISQLRGRYPELEPLIELIGSIDWELAVRASKVS